MHLIAVASQLRRPAGNIARDRSSVVRQRTLSTLGPASGWPIHQLTM